MPNTQHSTKSRKNTTMERDETNYDLKMQDRTYALNEIERLRNVIADLRTFTEQQRGMVRDNMLTGVSYLEEALWLLMEDV
jgi:hypothetical protein